jgi:hypothetical protein
VSFRTLTIIHLGRTLPYGSSPLPADFYFWRSEQELSAYLELLHVEIGRLTQHRSVDSSLSSNRHGFHRARALPYTLLYEVPTFLESDIDSRLSGST